MSCGDNNINANGCSGGYFHSAYNYIEKEGVGNSILYPYDSNAINQGIVSSCNTNLINNPLYKISKTFIRSSHFIPHGDCAALVKQLKISSISVSIAAQGLQFYASGTYKTESKVINHGVVLVGYDPIN